MSMTNSLSYRHKIIKYPVPKTQHLFSVLAVTLRIPRACGDCWHETLLTEGAALQSPTSCFSRDQGDQATGEKGLQVHVSSAENSASLVPCFTHGWTGPGTSYLPGHDARGSRATPSASPLLQTLSSILLKVLQRQKRPKGL